MLHFISRYSFNITDMQAIFGWFHCYKLGAEDTITLSILSEILLNVSFGWNSALKSYFRNCNFLIFILMTDIFINVLTLFQKIQIQVLSIVVNWVLLLQLQAKFEWTRFERKTNLIFQLENCSYHINITSKLFLTN